MSGELQRSGSRMSCRSQDSLKSCLGAWWTLAGVGIPASVSGVSKRSGLFVFVRAELSVEGDAERDVKDQSSLRW